MAPSRPFLYVRIPFIALSSFVAHGLLRCIAKIGGWSLLTFLG